MPGVDVVDQMRKIFSVVLSHRTGKWTVRFAEVLCSFLLGEGYNIHRHLHAANPQKRHSHHQFKVSVTRGLLSHPIVHAVLTFKMNIVFLCTSQGVVGMETIEEKIRNADNAHTSSASLRIPYYCNKCKIGLHPECFGAYHAERGVFFSPSPGGRKRNRANRDEV